MIYRAPRAAAARVWSKRFGGAAGSEEAASVAVDGDGNVYLAGTYSGTIDFGGGPLTSAGDTDGFAAMFSPSGDFLVQRRYGGPYDDYCYQVRVGPDWGAVLLLVFSGDVDFGAGLVNGFGAYDVEILKLKPQ